MPSVKNILNNKLIRYTSLCILLIILFFTSVYKFNLFQLLGKIPDEKELINLKIPLTSQVYSEDSVLLFNFYQENRLHTEWSEIPEMFKKGLVVVEDSRFYEHDGVDWQSNFGLIWDNIRGKKRGGSTLTQQLVKNLFNTRSANEHGLLHKIPGFRMLAIKFKEWNIASKLEAIYSKDELLHMYINTVDFGGNHFGLRSASRYFFSKEPISLTTKESAILIGVLKASTSYHPVLHPEACKERRNVVLNLFHKHNLISKNELERFLSDEVETRVTHDEDLSPRSVYLKLALERKLNEWCEANGLDLYTDGLQIYSSIHSKLQDYSEQAVAEHLINMQRKFFKHWEGKSPWVDSHRKVIKGFLIDAFTSTKKYDKLSKKYNGDTSLIHSELRKPHPMKVFTWKGVKDTILSAFDSLKYYKMFLQSGFISIDPNTGYIKSWVGGNDYRFFRLDHINQTKRQPGSTFKPFIYCTAIENGMTPCDTIIDKMIVHRYEEEGKIKTWIPRNADRVYTEDTMTLRFALGRSINSAAAQLSIKYSADSVMAMARRLGIKSPLKPVPSAGLGSNEVDLLELTSSYSAFINNGYRISPKLIKSIYTKDGELITKIKPKRERVLSEKTAWTMSYMLRGTLEEPYGTSQALFQNGTITHRNHIGGKTGTSSNYADGWYVGVTKNLIGGVWVGAEDQCIHFRTSTLGEGMKTALPIFGKFMEKVYSDSTLAIKKAYFSRPPRGTAIPNCKTKIRIIPYENRTDSLKQDSIEYYIDWPKPDTTAQL